MDEPDERLRPRVVSYSTGAINPVTLRTLMTQLVPTATVTADAKTRVIVALATPKEHEAIRAAVESLGKAEPAETAPTVVSIHCQRRARRRRCGCWPPLCRRPN